MTRLERSAVVLIVSAVLPASGWAQVRLGSEFQVNVYTTGHQEFPAVAWGAAGNFVVVWNSEPASANYSGVFARRFAGGGSALGGELEVKPTTGRANQAAVASDASGSFVVAWTADLDGSEDGVFAQRYDASGAAAGAEFRVNAYVTSYQIDPAIASGPNGTFVIVWHSFQQDGSGWGVFGQRYDGTGAEVGPEFRINTYTTGSQVGAAAASDAEGNFVVVWHSPQDGDGVGVFGQRYDASGATLGGEFPVNAYTTGPQLIPVVASAPDGRFLVAWRTMHQDGSWDGVYARLFDAAGAPLGADFRVNSYTTGYQIVHSVSADARGNFVVVWSGDGTLDGSGYGVMARLYDRAGRPHGADFVVNAHTAATQDYPSVAFGPGGRFAVTWHSNPNQDGSGHGVFGQVLAQDLVFRDGFE